MPPGRGTARGGRRRAAAAAPVTLAIALAALCAGAADASATTICVPGFTAACPNSAGNLAVADFEQAMSTQDSDGKADEIVVAAGTFTEVGGFEPAGGTSTTFEPAGTDPLTIVGAGPAQTTLTSGSTANTYVVNLASNNTRAITIRNLAIKAPASMPDGEGASILLDGDVLENVDIVSLNDASDGVATSGLGNAFLDGEVRGDGAGSIDMGVVVTSPGLAIRLEDDTIAVSSWALVAGGKSASLTARRVAVEHVRTYGAIATGGNLTIENSTITTDDGIGLYASAAADPTVLKADQVTVLNSGGATYPALEGKKFSGSAGSASISVTNSILRGFGSGFKTDTPFGPGIGIVSVSARYSNLATDGTSTGGIADLDTGASTGNIDVDPLLEPDLSLPLGSPSIDAGDPAGSGLPTDFLGAPRPVDGDGDCQARRDQGAFERQVPADPACDPIAPGPVADTTPPQTKIVSGPGGRLAKGRARFRIRSSEPGSTLLCKLDARRPVRCRSPKTYRHLRPGRHRFRAWAVDAAGNKDPTPAKRTFRVPRG